jgi:hypothetical protein
MERMAIRQIVTKRDNENLCSKMIYVYFAFQVRLNFNAIHTCLAAKRVACAAHSALVIHQSVLTIASILLACQNAFLQRASERRNLD